MEMLISKLILYFDRNSHALDRRTAISIWCGTFLCCFCLQTFTASFLLGWAAASSSWRGTIIQLPYAVARLNIAGYIDEHNYYFGTNSGKHKSNGGNGNSNSSSNNSSNNGTNHNTYGDRIQSNNGGLPSRLLYEKASSKRRFNKALYQQQQQQRRNKGQQVAGSKSKKSTVDHSRDCGKLSSVFTIFGCAMKFFLLPFGRSSSQQHIAEESIVPESKLSRVRRRRQGLAMWTNITVAPTQSPTPG